MSTFLPITHRFARVSALSSVALAFTLGALTGCEPQFTDGQCTVDSDCFPDERCSLGACRPLPPEEVELNVCGGEEVLENTPGGACGPCNLDRLGCEGTELVCDGETPCPELDVITTLPSNIAATSALLNARIDELPLDPITEMGFCWSIEEEVDSDDTCAALPTTPAVPGAFSLPISDLTPGTQYFVAAYSLQGEEFLLANEVNFITAPLRPVLSASPQAEGILLTWEEVPGATGYELSTSTEILATFDDEDAREYLDDTAPLGTLTAPGAVNASTSRTDGIRITWTSPVNAPGPEVEYTLVAVFADAESSPSEPASASRLGPSPTGYELQIGDGEPIELSLVNEYLDTDAPMGSIEAAAITVSKGEFLNQVILNSAIPSANPAADQTYRIRATYGTDEATPYSDAVTGQRSIGPFEYQWQRSAGQTDQDYTDLSDAVQRLSYDQNAPQDGSIRYYRLRIQADGAETTFSDADFGFSSTLGLIASIQAISLSDTTAILSASVEALGNPAADQHGICISTTPEPLFPGQNGETCIDLGIPELETPLIEITFEDLTPDTTHYARAFLRSSSGTIYTDDLTFQTLPAPPQAPADFAASSDNSEEITLTWSPVDNASGYRIYRDDELLVELSDGNASSYIVPDAPAPSVSLEGNPSATDATSMDFVSLAIAGISAEDGSAQTYAIIAYDALGRISPTSEATGFRPASAIENQWQYFDGTDWITLTTMGTEPFDYDDTTAPADGSYRSYRFVSRLNGLPSSQVESIAVDGRRGVPIDLSADIFLINDTVVITILVSNQGIPSGSYEICYGPSTTYPDMPDTTCVTDSLSGDTVTLTQDASSFTPGVEFTFEVTASNDFDSYNIVKTLIPNPV